MSVNCSSELSKTREHYLLINTLSLVFDTKAGLSYTPRDLLLYILGYGNPRREKSQKAYEETDEKTQVCYLLFSLHLFYISF